MEGEDEPKENLLSNKVFLLVTGIEGVEGGVEDQLLEFVGSCVRLEDAVAGAPEERGGERTLNVGGMEEPVVFVLVEELEEEGIIHGEGLGEEDHDRVAVELGEAKLEEGEELGGVGLSGGEREADHVDIVRKTALVVQEELHRLDITAGQGVAEHPPTEGGVELDEELNDGKR